MKYNKQISLGYDPATGKQIRKWIHANTQLELANKIQEAQRSLIETPDRKSVV